VILAAAVTGGLAVPRVAAMIPASAPSPAFTGTCDRADMIALTAELGRGVTCQPAWFGERAVFVTHGPTLAVFAAEGMRVLVPPTQIDHGPGWTPGYGITDLDGDGTDEIVVVSHESPTTYHFKPGVHSFQLRVLAVRDGHFAMTGEHAYAASHHVRGNAKWVYAHEALEAP
jgi:hypothetical protein